MFSRSYKGILALDIDGTLTSEIDNISPEVCTVMQNLSKDWLIVFLTGRPFAWGYRTLQRLNFQYVLAVQNGALLMTMPGQEILTRKYLNTDNFGNLADICRQYETDFVIYSGFENQDRCYYRPSFLSPSTLYYVLRRSKHLQENWVALETFTQLPVAHFASLKCFVGASEARALSMRIETELGLHAPPNRDPFDPHYCIIQATHANATKGETLRELIHLTSNTGPIIAAGDDLNDYSMLQQADVKIVMANAPPEMLAIADVIAPPASQKGIIQGLKKAFQLIFDNI